MKKLYPSLIALTFVVTVLFACATLPKKENPTTVPTQILTALPAPGNTPVDGSLTPTYEPALRTGSTQIRKNDGMTMVYVPAGPFSMGSNAGEVVERPVHTVTLDAFWIDQTEVSNAMFQVFVKTLQYQTDAEKIGMAYFLDPSSKTWQRVDGVNWQHPQGPGSSLDGLDDHPVVDVSWNDASAYCAWAGGRLPSEAEWEKAARGTDGQTYPWGNAAPNGELLNFADVNLDVAWADRTIDDGNQFSAPVSGYPKGASPYGALNMAGNVWEWVSDWYDVYPGGDQSTSPDFGTTYRVLRGGSWDYQDGYTRSAYRLRGTPYDAGSNIGFRCANPLNPNMTLVPKNAIQPSEPAGSCVDPSLNLKGWWRAEDDATDSAGNHDGMFVSNSVFAPGKVGRAFRFNGTDNLVAIPDSDEWTIGVNDFTLDMWVNFDAIQSRTAFAGHDEGGGSTNKWIFWYDEFGDDGSPGAALRFHINPSTGLRNPIFAFWAPKIGQWYHLAITKNDSLYTLYIDGVQVATSVHTDAIPDAAAPLTIGSSEGFFFNGLIDEVHFFSSGLSASEIQKIFNTGSAGICALNTTDKTTPVPTVTISQITPTAPASAFCPLAPATRVKIGDTARIGFSTGQTTRLRAAPESGDNLIAMLPEGTELKVIGGPVCYPRPGRSDAYVYWKVLVVSTSKEGWLAEGDLNTYYIEPWP